jgi:hypothetical protein
MVSRIPIGGPGVTHARSQREINDSIADTRLPEPLDIRGIKLVNGPASGERPDYDLVGRPILIQLYDLFQRERPAARNFRFYSFARSRPLDGDNILSVLR